MSKPKLNQIIAIEKGTKSRSLSDLTEAHHALQKPALLAGISRNYRPRDEEGEQLPAEATRVQIKAEEIVRRTADVLSKLFDVVASKDWANTRARADVVVDGQVLLAQVPVSYLIFLEKQLVDLHTFIKKLPVLDAAEHWTFDPSADCWATEPVQTTRTKKIPRNHVKAEATEKHPAQVEVYYEDVIVGTWKTIKFSGALPASRVNHLLERIEKLQQSVKFAREEANATEVDEQKVGHKVLGFLFGPLNKIPGGSALDSASVDATLHDWSAKLSLTLRFSAHTRPDSARSNRAPATRPGSPASRPHAAPTAG